MLVDSHHHFWDPSSATYPWMQGPLVALRQRFDPARLRPLVRRNSIDRTVLVQTRSSHDETLEFLEIATQTDFVAGVVGWLDLTDPSANEQLSHLRESRGGSALVGIRHQVHDEPDPDWLLREDVQRGLSAVLNANLVFDLLIRLRELPAALSTVRGLPGLRFVVDHAVKPDIRGGSDHEQWKASLASLAEHSNVYCKLSGLVVEADWLQWQPRDLRPYVDHVLACFGASRVMFGSDWPVCLLAASYDEVFDATREALADLSANDRSAVLGTTAAEFYRLPGSPR